MSLFGTVRTEAVAGEVRAGDALDVLIAVGQHSPTAVRAICIGVVVVHGTGFSRLVQTRSAR